ncbi:hypothetical protein FIU93_22870 [Labrenzia sp. THAF35]|uniref:hypothetical protein n=1 Tax=Labrenzia sp. THAF35 TaxID=2587854 RepID=UPI001267C69A|nr:hypothetical protein [Labrenzia sp. THAF35]QFT69645.1 hypothetical protein FIU93_22870 [Labrenzia sp. THAF35]
MKYIIAFWIAGTLFAHGFVGADVVPRQESVADAAVFTMIWPAAVGLELSRRGVTVKTADRLR